MDIGTALQGLRILRSLTVEKVSHIAGVSQDDLIRIELGELKPTQLQIKKLAIALDTTVTMLLFLAADEQDIPEDKKEIFEFLKQLVISVLERASE